MTFVHHSIHTLFISDFLRPFYLQLVRRFTGFGSVDVSISCLLLRANIHPLSLLYQSQAYLSSTIDFNPCLQSIIWFSIGLGLLHIAMLHQLLLKINYTLRISYLSLY